MSLLDLFRRKEKEPLQDGTEEEYEEPEVYSGMRVEVTSTEGHPLFAGKLMSPNGGRAELYQYTEGEAPESEEPLPVRIRGYNDRKRKAVYMEGTVSPLPKHIWRVEDLHVVRAGNDRAFFRLETNLPASITVFGSGFGGGERECRLLNISVGGARISMDSLLHAGDRFLLKVKLLEDRDTSVMYCEVLRVIEGKDGTFEYGSRFLELTEADQDKISQSIFAAQLKERNGR